MKTRNIVTINDKDPANYKHTQKLIDRETKRRVRMVKCSEQYGIMTAAVLDGEFILVSNYTLPDGFYEALENA